MKTNILPFSLVILFLSSCLTPKYLPEFSKIDVNEYGSYIKITRKTSFKIDGELLAIDNDKIIVLTKETKKCLAVSFSDVKSFKLMYAKPKHYGWTIPAFIAYPFMHGWYSVFTIPIHLVVTISVTATGENSYNYSDKNISMDKLKMFARFPQGIPPNLDLRNIK
jgi:hypothetical protein